MPFGGILTVNVHVIFNIGEFLFECVEARDDVIPSVYDSFGDFFYLVGRLLFPDTIALTVR